MKQAHFQTLAPVCPLCRQQHQRDFPLQIGFTVRGHGDQILEGALQCSNPACQCEYPIIDGIPLLVPQIRTYLNTNAVTLLCRGDLSPELMAMVGEGAGPGSWLDSARQYHSSYAWDHYAGFDGEEAAGCVARAAAKAFELAGDWPAGPAIDIGCSAGRATFELAARTSDLVLGVDLNFAMVKLAHQALSGRLTYDRRKMGMIYERREIDLRFAGSDRVDFWVADALSLPFAHRSFSAALALNVLDAVSSPIDLLRQLRHILRPGAKAMLSTPYDWNGSVTPIEGWIGGHSPRAQAAGSGPALLRALLTPEGHLVSVDGLELFAEQEHFPWRVRLHERNTLAYDIHIAVARATDR